MRTKKGAKDAPLALQTSCLPTTDKIIIPIKNDSISTMNLFKVEKYGFLHFFVGSRISRFPFFISRRRSMKNIFNIFSLILFTAYVFFLLHGIMRLHVSRQLMKTMIRKILFISYEHEHQIRFRYKFSFNLIINEFFHTHKKKQIE